jgi:hypothetical protein
MAEKQNASLKISAHTKDDFHLPHNAGSQKPKKIFTIIIIVTVLLAVIFASAFYLFFLGPKSVDKKEALTSDNVHKVCNSNETIEFTFTVYNPSQKSDDYITSVSGFPSDWEINLPHTVTVDGKKEKDEKLTITPSPTALNRTYSLKLEVISLNTYQKYSLDLKLTIPQTYGFELLCYNGTHKALSGRSTFYGLVFFNSGNGRDLISLSYNHLPSNWNLSFADNPVFVSSYSSKVVKIKITTHQDSPQGNYAIQINALSSGGQEKSIWLMISLIKDLDSEAVKIGDKIQVHWIGLEPDGLIFGTSLEEVAFNEDYPKHTNFSFMRTYSPLKMYVGETDPDYDAYMQVIEGFWQSVLGLKANETILVTLPPEKAYRDGITRIFEITVVSIDN